MRHLRYIACVAMASLLVGVPATEVATAAPTTEQFKKLSRTVKKQARQIRSLSGQVASLRGRVDSLTNEKNAIVAAQQTLDRQQNDAIGTLGQRLAAVNGDSVARDQNLLNLGNSLADYVFSLCEIPGNPAYPTSTLPDC